MKQLTVRAIGWGVLTTMTLVQLPVLAAAESVNRTADQSASQSASHAATAASDGSLLLAVGLTRRSLRQGDAGADVRALQLYLGRNGLYPFQVDGIYGQETADGVATYQRIRDLPATGIADEETLRDMEFEFLPGSNASAPTRAASNNAGGSVASDTLGPGSTGSSVTALQQRLNDLGIPVFVDGVYGFETQQGIRTYQRVQGLAVTGTADRETLSSMGFSVSNRPSRPYISAVIGDESDLASIREIFPEAFIDRERGGRFINIGSFDSRSPAEARVDVAAARGFNARVIYRRRGFFL
ncbi:peptidoglycan-binding protein [cf. Phormidesmis sp. LEGE 11477]|nr:peptidoglycan-binding protein [cf. Phormidesmis sp. LEGE 11477]